jgi:hypothetical protein
MRLSEVLVILFPLVRRILIWRVLELKQKAFLEAGNNFKLKILAGRGK